MDKAEKLEKNLSYLKEKEWIQNSIHACFGGRTYTYNEVAEMLQQYTNDMKREEAIDFLNYMSCIEDFSNPRGLDKENIRLYDEWKSKQI